MRAHQDVSSVECERGFQALGPHCSKDGRMLSNATDHAALLGAFRRSKRLHIWLGVSLVHRSCTTSGAALASALASSSSGRFMGIAFPSPQRDVHTCTLWSTHVHTVARARCLHECCQHAADKLFGCINPNQLS